MSELAITSSPRIGAWLSLDEASRRSGITIQRLRDYAAKKYAPAGLAEKRLNPQTGQVAWQINEGADERFQVVRPTTPALVSQIGTEEQLAVARDRQAVMQELDRQLTEDEMSIRPIGRRKVVERFSRHLAERGRSASPATLYAWRSAWLDAGRDLHALMPRQFKTDLADNAQFGPFFELLETLYLIPGAAVQKSSAYRAARLVAERDGIPVPHPKMAQRHLQTLDQRKSLQVSRYRLAVGHPDPAQAFAGRSLAYIPRDRSKFSEIAPDGSVRLRDLRSDDIWCGDHHVCDTLVRFEGKLIRPWLTAFLDIRSNKIVGRFWSPKAPNKHNVLLALRDAVIRCGMSVPTRWYVDNGKDFDAWMFSGVTKWEKKRFKVKNDREHCGGLLAALQIETMRAAPYNAKAKPVERFFGIFEEGFGKFTWTYCGNTPQNKPDHLAERLRGDHVPTFEEYILDADHWIDAVHHHEPLTTRLDKGLSREQVWTQNRTTIRTAPAERLEYLLTPIERAKVGRQGVVYRGWHFHDPALVPYQGQEISLRVNPADVRTVIAFTTDWKTRIGEIASLDLAAYGPVSDEQAETVQRRIAEIKRLQRKLSLHGGVSYIRTDHRSLLDDVRRAAAAPPPALPSPEPTMKLIQTPVDDDSIEPQKRLPAPRETTSIDIGALADALEQMEGEHG